MSIPIQVKTVSRASNMKLSVALLALGLACAAQAAPTVDPGIPESLSIQGSVDILITFRDYQTASIRNRFKHLSFNSRTNLIQSFYATLKSHADATQKNVLALLNQSRTTSDIKIRQLWLTNKIIVKKADSTLIDSLASMPEIDTITRDRLITTLKPIDAVDASPRVGEQWGVALLDAPSVWADGNSGNGTVIANIDTGVRGTHEALRDGLRSVNSWYDPAQGTKVPTDDNGHGTHTMGTICGRANGIGVAPGAQWIACRGCARGGGCYQFDLEECAQWIVCPTDEEGNNPRCDLAPNAVSNSWGGGQDEKWYDPYIDSWITAGIAALFANGNDGPGCRSANSPADSIIEPIAVGATTSIDEVASFSSIGPTIRYRRFKPDISAPGEGVYSSLHSSDTAYGTGSGTSMACPHAAGLTALLYSARPSLTHRQIADLLIAGAQPTKSSERECLGISDTVFPNYQAGYGRISARASIDELNRWTKA